MTISSLTSHINNLFKTKFKTEQIRYRVNKALENTFGKPDSDAFFVLFWLMKKYVKMEEFSRAN